MGQGTVIWGLKKQYIVALSSTEAKYIVQTSVATARLDSASAWSPRLFQIGKTEPRLMAGLRLNHGLTSQNGYGE